MATAPPPDGFPDEAESRGLRHVNRSGTPAKRDILEANGAGLALFDLEADGDLDLAVGQGLEQLEALRNRGPGGGADIAIFAGDGRGMFEPRPGPGLAGWWTGFAAGDVDGDGDTDLVVGGFGDIALLLQDVEHGLLVPWSEAGLSAGTGTGRAPGWVTSMALFDADRDGTLDLYVGRYLDLDPHDPPRGALGEGELAVPCRWRGQDVFCGPAGLVPQSDILYLGNGDGSFRDVTRETLGQDAPAGYTLGVTVGDFDADGRTDIYVACDSAPNQLWINRTQPGERARFAEIAWTAGVALSSDGAAEAGMGVATGDFDRDGRTDIVCTNFSGEPTELFLGAEIGFRDASYRTGLASLTKRLLSWGVHMCDFDGDSWLDIFTANGHVYPQADRDGTGTSYAQADTLFTRTANGRIELVEPVRPDSILALVRGTRGSAVGDVDGDGAPDLVLSVIDGPLGLGMNRLAPHNHRLVVHLEGPQKRSAEAPRTPRDATGARVAVVLEGGDVALLGEKQSAQGFQSASAGPMTFGLGSSEQFVSLRVFWPSGRVEDLPGGAGDRWLRIREGAGVVAEGALVR